MLSDTRLFVDHGALRGAFDDNSDDEHRDREDQKSDDRSQYVNKSLDDYVDRIGQRNIADIDDRQSVKILDVGHGRYHGAVIRHELGMDTGFLADADYPFKLLVLID